MSLLLLASCGNCALSSVHEVGSAAQQSTIICCTSQQCTDQPRVMTIHTPTCPSARAAQDLSLKDALRGALENFLQSPLSYCVPGADSEAPAHTARRTVFSCSGASGVHRHGSLGRCRAPAAAHMQPLLSLGCCISATAWRGSWTLHTRCMLLCMRAHGEPHLPQGERPPAGAARACAPPAAPSAGTPSSERSPAQPIGTALPPAPSCAGVGRRLLQFPCLTMQQTAVPAWHRAETADRHDDTAQHTQAEPATCSGRGMALLCRMGRRAHGCSTLKYTSHYPLIVSLPLLRSHCLVAPPLSPVHKDNVRAHIVRAGQV